MSTESIYFKIPPADARSVLDTLVHAIPGSWCLADDSVAHVLFCKVRRGKRPDHQARCHIVAEPFVGAFGKEAGPQPPRIKLGYSADCGGRREHIEALEALCRSLGLEQYIPQP